MLCGLSSRGTSILLNFVFFSVGLIVLSVGVWSQYDKNFSTLWNTFEISKIIDARGLNGASLLLIVSGLSSVIVSFAGLYGSIKKEKCFITTYCLFICVILILEVSAASVFVAYQSQARDKLREGLNKTVAEINKDYDKAALQVMNTIQTGISLIYISPLSFFLMILKIFFSRSKCSNVADAMARMTT